MELCYLKWGVIINLPIHCIIYSNEYTPIVIQENNDVTDKTLAALCGNELGVNISVTCIKNIIYIDIYVGLLAQLTDALQLVLTDAYQFDVILNNIRILQKGI